MAKNKVKVITNMGLPTRYLLQNGRVKLPENWVSVD